ncbi:hypothetical protein HMN09_01267900 [Mycena chlorophos]|uniref:Uncharacterized protein n=1 Tax=Mycena chlorophos TaxID=658473 RepID=A0A8H6S290_MYCCL|nr:hypothetical protein HMN09_01267900 [Mycena chlorophos]
MPQTRASSNNPHVFSGASEDTGNLSQVYGDFAAIQRFLADEDTAAIIAAPSRSTELSSTRRSSTSFASFRANSSQTRHFSASLQDDDLSTPESTPPATPNTTLFMLPALQRQCSSTLYNPLLKTESESKLWRLRTVSDSLEDPDELDSIISQFPDPPIQISLESPLRLSSVSELRESRDHRAAGTMAVATPSREPQLSLSVQRLKHIDETDSELSQRDDGSGVPALKAGAEQKLILPAEKRKMRRYGHVWVARDAATGPSTYLAMMRRCCGP